MPDIVIFRTADGFHRTAGGKDGDMEETAGEDPDRHQRLPARAERPLRRRPSARPLHHRHPGTLVRVGPRLSRRWNTACPSPARRCASSAIRKPPSHDDPDPRGPYGRHARLGRRTAEGAGRGGAVRLYLQEPVAQLRDGGGEGLRRLGRWPSKKGWGSLPGPS